jgi:uncharacterized RDD family membrane protein YckC
MSQLVTGEAVALDLRPARLVSRMIATVIDFGIEAVALWAFTFAFANTISISDSDWALAIGILVAGALVVGYPVAWETLWNGRTPGKAALGIRVVRDDGGSIRFRHALTRALFNVIERPGITFGSAAVIVSLLSRRGKRIGDLVAGTFVLQERLPKQRLTPISMPPQLAAWAATLDLSRLPDDLALAVRSFLGRAGDLRPDARDRLGTQLAQSVAACTSPSPPPGTPGWAYLAAVIAERRRRDEARLPQRERLAWGPPPPSPGWGPAPANPPWSSSSPSTGTPPPVGPPPPVGSRPRDPGPPPVPAAPSPQWGPPPVKASPPPPEPSPPPPDGGFATPA